MANESVSKCWYNAVCDLSTGENCSKTQICVRYLEMDYLVTSSGIPKHRQIPVQLVPEEQDYNQFCELADWKDNVVKNISMGKNLYIGSKHTGNGKTSWAIKILLKYFDSVWAGNGFVQRGAFIYVPTFLAKLKDFDNVDKEFNELKSVLSDLDVVVWDDIGSNNLSNYDLSQMCNYIDQRVSMASQIYLQEIY